MTAPVIDLAAQERAVAAYADDLEALIQAIETGTRPYTDYYTDYCDEYTCADRTAAALDDAWEELRQVREQLAGLRKPHGGEH